MQYKSSISKRTLITRYAAASTVAMLPGFPVHSLAAAPQQIVAGAIRWDAWYTRADYSLDAQNNLSPRQFHGRAPAHCKVTSETAVSCVGSQKVMDAEITAAVNAGLKFWAFVWYGSNSSLRTAWSLYQTSSKKNQINWCGIATLSALVSVPVSNRDWQSSVQQWADFMCGPNYQRISSDGLANRPLLFLLWHDNEVMSFFDGDMAKIRNAITLLHERVAAAGFGSPYIVVLHGVAGASAASVIGAQAISNYISAFRPAHSGTYNELDRQIRDYWATLASTGRPIVPIGMIGWDTRARNQSPGRFHIDAAPDQYYALANPSELAGHIRAAVRYIHEHPRVCPSKVLLIYSWDECDEGGGLIPTIGDPTGSYLSAIAPEIKD